jgi:hypothetical protein
VAFIPFDDAWFEVSLNKLFYEPEDNVEEYDETWGAIEFSKDFESIWVWGAGEAYSGGRKSLYGGIGILVGKEIYGTATLQGGKTWNGYEMGHGSYRIGGDIGEGYFTNRPSRLMPLRGFDSNILDAGKAMAGSVEIYWPLVNLQKGYKTVPLFLHMARIGTFVDAGACADHMTRDELLVGAGVELVTSMEVAWGNFSTFRAGLAWPVEQPDYLDEKSPVANIQIGMPL